MHTFLIVHVGYGSKNAITVRFMNSVFSPFISPFFSIQFGIFKDLIWFQFCLKVVNVVHFLNFIALANE